MKFPDLVRVFSTSAGNGDFTPNEAVQGFRSFDEAGLVTGDEFYYSIINLDVMSEREVGVGTILANGDFSRAPLHSGAKINFSTGLKSVALTVGSEWFEELEVIRLGGGGGGGPPANTDITDAIAVGDSQTVGGGWADAIFTDLTPLGITGTKVAQGSRYLGVPADNNTMNTGWGHIQEVKDLLTAADGVPVVFYFMGHNDLGSYKGLATGPLRAQQYYTDTLAYFAALRAVRSDVLIIWIIPTTATAAFGAYASLNDGVQSIRPLIRAGAGVDNFDAFADFGAHPQFVPPDLTANVAADGLHISPTSGGTYLRDVLRAVLDGFLVPQTGNTPAAFDLGTDATNVALSTDILMDTMIKGLGPRQSITSAAATNGQIKQGFGTYGSTIGAGQLFNGDVIRSKHTTSGSNSTQTTYTLTLNPGGHTDSRAFTTASASARSPATAWVTGNGIAISNVGKTATSPGDGGGSPWIHTNQSMIAGRKNYWEMHVDSIGSPTEPYIGLTDPSMDPLGVGVPGNGANVGIAYRGGGYIYANGGIIDFGNPNHDPFATFSVNNWAGCGSRDNGDGTSTVWFLDRTGTLLVPYQQTWTMFSTGGWTVPSVNLRPSAGIRGVDVITANWTGPFVHLTAGQLAAFGAHAVDE